MLRLRILCIFSFLVFFHAWLPCQESAIPSLDIAKLQGTVPARAAFMSGGNGLDQNHALDLFLAGESLPANQEALQGHLPTTEPLWYGFRIRNTGPTDRSVSIEVLESRLDHVDLWYYSLSSKNAFEIAHLHSGLMVPITERPIHHARLYFPLSLDTGSEIVVLARIETTRDLKTQIVIHDDSHQTMGFQVIDLFEGTMQGVQLTGMIFILLMSFLVRKREYYFFVLSGFSFSLFSLMVSVGGGWIFGQWPMILRNIPFLFYGIGLLGLAEYSRIHIDLESRHPLLNKLVLWAYLGLPAAGIIQTQSTLLALVICFTLQVSTMICFIAVALRANPENAKDLRSHIPAWLALGVSSLLFLIDYLGLSGDGFASLLTVSVSRFCIMASFFIFSFILILQVKKLLGQKEDAEERERISRSFLSSMSHEMRSPLNGILGYAQNLDSSLDDQQLSHYRQRIQEEAHVLLQKVDRMLDVVRCDTGNIEMNSIRFSPSVMLRQLYSQWEQIATHKGLGFSVDIDPALNTFVSADRIRLEQILSLLLDNAVKFTSRGGIILSGMVRAVSDKGLSCRFSVTDTGQGISADHMERMFSPETQSGQGFPCPQENRARSGIGVGLSLTQRLCALFNARLRVESIEGKGSVFSMDVFLVHARRDAYNPEGTGQGPGTVTGNSVQPEVQTPGLTSLRNKAREDLPLFAQADMFRKKSGQTRILVVDDLPTNRQVITIHLSRTGIAIDEAENGSQALELINMNTYDLVLMDIYMPGMDGFETTRRIRQTFSASRLPVIGITASTEENDLRECIASGMNCFLLKPLSKEKLLSIIMNFIQIKP